MVNLLVVIIIFFSRCVCRKREIKLWELLCFLSVAYFLSSAWWSRIKMMFCFTLLVLNAKNLPPLDTNGTWYVLLDAVRRLQRRYFVSAAKIQTSINIIRFPVHKSFEYNSPRMSKIFFFYLILGSRLRTTPFFVFSYALLNKTTFGNFRVVWSVCNLEIATRGLIWQGS